MTYNSYLNIRTVAAVQLLVMAQSSKVWDNSNKTTTLSESVMVELVTPNTDETAEIAFSDSSSKSLACHIHDSFWPINKQYIHVVVSVIKGTSDWSPFVVYFKENCKGWEQFPTMSYVNKSACILYHVLAQQCCWQMGWACPYLLQRARDPRGMLHSHSRKEEARRKQNFSLHLHDLIWSYEKNAKRLDAWLHYNYAEHKSSIRAKCWHSPLLLNTIWVQRVTSSWYKALKKLLSAQPLHLRQ